MMREGADAWTLSRAKLGAMAGTELGWPLGRAIGAPGWEALAASCDRLAEGALADVVRRALGGGAEVIGPVAHKLAAVGGMGLGEVKAIAQLARTMAVAMVTRC